MPRFLSCAVFLLLVATSAFAAEPTPAKPSIATAKDGFPTGTDTPEGAACDFARAFIQNDGALLLATCIEPYGTPEARTAYHDFLRDLVVQMKLVTPGNEPAPESPKDITRCFAARHLGVAGPVSGGYATYGFQDVMFVDVTSRLQNGDTQLCRTLVIKNQQGKWLVDPQPEATPSLSNGLDDEAPSTRDFSEDYVVHPASSPTASPPMS